MPLQPNDAFYQKGYEILRDRVRRMAGQVKPDEDTKKLTQDEIDTLWDTRSMPREQEWALWRQGNLSREQIGMMVHPYREPLAKSDGRLEPVEVTRWVNKQEQRMQAKRAAMAPPIEPGLEGY